MGGIVAAAASIYGNSKRVSGAILASSEPEKSALATPNFRLVIGRVKRFYGERHEDSDNRGDRVFGTGFFCG